MTDRGYDLLFNAPGRTYTPLGVGGHSTSNYYPPPAIVNLAQDTTRRGVYSFKKRWPGPVAEGGSRNSDDPDGILTFTKEMKPDGPVIQHD